VGTDRRQRSALAIEKKGEGGHREKPGRKDRGVGHGAAVKRTIGGEGTEGRQNLINKFWERVGGKKR